MKNSKWCLQKQWDGDVCCCRAVQAEQRRAPEQQADKQKGQDDGDSLQGGETYMVPIENL